MSAGTITITSPSTRTVWASSSPTSPGSGVSAALLMASLRGALHEKFPGTDDLSELAAKLNDFVYSSSDSHLFISFFLAIVDRSTDEVAYINAGHNPPLVQSRQGPARSLESTGLCLGMFPAQLYAEQKVVLQPGDILCLYTDGIVESRQGGTDEYRGRAPGGESPGLRRTAGPGDQGQDLRGRLGVQRLRRSRRRHDPGRRQAESMRAGRGGHGDRARGQGASRRRRTSTRSTASGASSGTPSPACPSARRTGSRSSWPSTRSSSISPATPTPRDARGTSRYGSGGTRIRCSSRSGTAAFPSTRPEEEPRPSGQAPPRHPRRIGRLFLQDADGRPILPTGRGRERPDRPQGHLISRRPCSPR